MAKINVPWSLSGGLLPGGAYVSSPLISTEDDHTSRRQLHVIAVKVKVKVGYLL